jgi:hypothetical protein
MCRDLTHAQRCILWELLVRWDTRVARTLAERWVETREGRDRIRARYPELFPAWRRNMGETQAAMAGKLEEQIVRRMPTGGLDPPVPIQPMSLPSRPWTPEDREAVGRPLRFVDAKVMYVLGDTAAWVRGDQEERTARKRATRPATRTTASVRRCLAITRDAKGRVLEVS